MLAELSFPHAIHSMTFASLRLFTCLVYVSTYCVPIAHLRQNKPVCITLFGPRPNNKKRAECIVELYKHAGIFKNTKEVLERHEPQANASRTSKVFLRWLNTVLLAVSGNSRDGVCFKLDKQTWRRKKLWYTKDDFSKTTL